MSAEPFSWALYGHYLDVALECGYGFIGAGSLADAAPPPQRSILLRHDVDYDPAWIGPMAALEHERGVRSTYCLLTSSPLYSIEERRTTAAVEGLLERGHWLGLHLDASGVESDEDAISQTTERAAMLSERFGTEVRAVSFHMPGRRPVGHLELPRPLLNLYGPRFFEEIGYVSDSNQDWRGQDLERVLRSGEHGCLQVLIHPFWWRERYGTILEKLEEVASAQGADPDSIITPEQREIAARQASAPAR